MTETNQAPAIILCGGDINYTSLPIGTNVSNSMVPVNGKPVIAWILDDLIRKGVEEVVIVLQEKNKKLYNFTQWAYSKRVQVKYAHVASGGSIINSLMGGLNALTSETSVHLVLGDTLIQDDFGGDEDFVYVGANDFTDNWCLVEYDDDGEIQSYHDKVKIKRPEVKILTGYYYLKDSKLLER
ncbi:MAG: sugar phosphate nucleotidyltransferase, partial [Owenweeksia sp.]